MLILYHVTLLNLLISSSSIFSGLFWIFCVHVFWFVVFFFKDLHVGFICTEVVYGGVLTPGLAVQGL